MVLGVIITKIGCSWSPKIFDFPLGASVLNPIEVYVNGLGPLLLQDFFSKWIRCVIVHLYYCWGLWVSHFYESCAFMDHVLWIYKQCPNFLLCCERHDICHDFAYVVNGEIVRGVLTVITEIMIAARSDAHLGQWKLWCITVDLQNHITLFVSDNCCWVAGEKSRSHIILS